MNRTLALILTVLLLGGQYKLGQAVRGFSPADQRLLTLPKAEMAHLVSLGNSRALADWYWTQSVLYFGRYWLEEGKIPPTVKSLNFSMELLPESHEIAFYGGWILCSNDVTCPELGNFARRIASSNRASWITLRDLAMISFMELQDFKLAQGLIKVAQQRPEAVLTDLKQIEGYILTRSGREDFARAFYTNLYQNAPTPQLKSRAGVQLKRYTMVAHLRSIQNVLQEYVDNYNTVPKTIQDLVNFKGIQLPGKDPFGGSYVIKDGLVESTTAETMNLLKNKYMDKNPLIPAQPRLYFGPPPPQNLKAPAASPLEQQLNEIP